jgi:hypothetical protein
MQQFGLHPVVLNDDHAGGRDSLGGHNAGTGQTGHWFLVQCASTEIHFLRGASLTKAEPGRIAIRASANILATGTLYIGRPLCRGKFLQRNGMKAKVSQTWWRRKPAMDA